MKKRRLKKWVKKALYIILLGIIFIVLCNIIPYNEKPFDDCINEGNGLKYCSRNYGQ